MLSGLIGRKLGMTQVGDPAGRVLAVTVIQLGPCAVTQIKAEPTDGYNGVQVTFGRQKLTRVSQAQRGHFAKAEVAPGIATREFARRGESELKLGQIVAAADVWPSARGTASPVLSNAIISQAFPARAERTSTSVMADRSVTDPTLAGFARDSAWRARWAMSWRPF